MSAMHSAIVTMSASFMPLDVTAGVPNLKPLVMNGDCLSNGIAFLLAVMCARSSKASTSLPVLPVSDKSTSMRWLSVPPETRRMPLSTSSLDSFFALRTIWV